MEKTTNFTHEQIQKEFDSLPQNTPYALSLRVHRSISWIKCCENCEESDMDAKFIFLWIAFNAAYASEDILFNEWEADISERDMQKNFFDELLACDKENIIYNSLWNNFSQSIAVLMDNPYIFAPFWKYQNGISEYVNWEERFNRSKKTFQKALYQENSARVLTMVFERLYVLRNQIMHGGSTWQSSINRHQLADGTKILQCFVPIFIHILIDNPYRNWGRPFYPPVE